MTRDVAVRLAAGVLAVGLAAPATIVLAQDGGGFVAPVEDPIEDDASTGGSTIQGGGAATAVSLYTSPRVMYATTSSVVRSGPGTGHAQVGTIPRGGQVTVLGDAPGGSWLYLELASGARGFTASYLLSANPPTATSSGTSTPSTTAVPTAPSTPICQPGEVVIRMADGSSICARLQ